MITTDKLYLSLGLLFSLETITYSYDENMTNKEIIEEVEKIHNEAESIQEKIDRELFEIFHKFFGFTI